MIYTSLVYLSQVVTSLVCPPFLLLLSTVDYSEDIHKYAFVISYATWINYVGEFTENAVHLSIYTF